MSAEKSNAIISFFYREKLARRLVISLDDQVEKNREITIEILTKVIERVGLKDESQILLPAIANRMNKIPFAEQCKLHKLIYDSWGSPFGAYRLAWGVSRVRQVHIPALDGRNLRHAGQISYWQQPRNETQSGVIRRPAIKSATR